MIYNERNFGWLKNTKLAIVYSAQNLANLGLCLSYIVYIYLLCFSIMLFIQKLITLKCYVKALNPFRDTHLDNMGQTHLITFLRKTQYWNKHTGGLCLSYREYLSPLFFYKVIGLCLPWRFGVGLTVVMICRFLFPWVDCRYLYSFLGSVFLILL